MLLFGATDSSARYWVGGTGVWNASNTLNWSYYSGGPGGAPVPTLENNVYIDANSDIGAAFEIHLFQGTCNCKNLNIFPEYFLQLHSYSADLRIHGGFSCADNTLVDFSNLFGTLDFNASSGIYNIDTKGNPLFFDSYSWGVTSSGTIYNLLSELNLRGSLIYDYGSWLDIASGITINTNNHTLRIPEFQCSATVNAGTSNIYTSGGYVEFFQTVTGSPTIYIDNFNIIRYGYISTTFINFANVYLEAPYLNYSMAHYFNTPETISNLYIRAPSEGSIYVEIQDGTQITNLIFLDTKQNSRIQLYGSDYPSNVTVGSITNPSDIDFEAINILGTAAPVTGTRLRVWDLIGGTGITASTFTPKTVYWSNLNGGTLYSNSYAFSSGGTPTLSAYPFHTDTVIIDDNGLLPNKEILLSPHAWNTHITDFYITDFSSRTQPLTIRRTDSYIPSGSYALSRYYFSALFEIKFPLVDCLTFDVGQKFQLWTGSDIGYTRYTTPLNFSPRYSFIAYAPGITLYRPTTLLSDLISDYLLIENSFDANNFNVTSRTSISLPNADSVYFRNGIWTVGSSITNENRAFSATNNTRSNVIDLNSANIVWKPLAGGRRLIFGDGSYISYLDPGASLDAPPKLKLINSLKIEPQFSDGTNFFHIEMLPKNFEFKTNFSCTVRFRYEDIGPFIQNIESFIVEGPTDTLLGPIKLQGIPTHFNYIGRNSISLKNVTVDGIYVYPDKTWYATEGIVVMNDRNGWIFDSTIPAVSSVDSDNIVTASQSNIVLTGTNLSTMDGVQLRQGNNILNTTNFVAGSSPTFTAPTISQIFSSGIKFGSVQLDIMENI